MDEFEVLEIRDNHIEVRDRETGHRYSFGVVFHPDGDRMLSMDGQCRENELAATDYRDLAPRARNFAQARMKEAGHIDRFNP
jgi:hypothetical protein